MVAACALRCTARLNTVQGCTFIAGDNCHVGSRLARINSCIPQREQLCHEDVNFVAACNLLDHISPWSCRCFHSIEMGYGDHRLQPQECTKSVAHLRTCAAKLLSRNRFDTCCVLCSSGMSPRWP